MNKALTVHLTRILEEGWLGTIGTIPRCPPEAPHYSMQLDRLGDRRVTAILAMAWSAEELTVPFACDRRPR